MLHVGATGMNQPKPIAFLNKSQMFKENFAAVPERKRLNWRRWKTTLKCVLKIWAGLE
jgi:hypothetical protein